MREDTEGSRGYVAVLSDPPVLVVAMVVFVAMIGFEAASPALPVVADAFEITDAQVGLVMTAFSAPMVLFVPVTGVLADLYGRRSVLLPSLVAFGIAGVAIGGAPSFRAILLLRVIQGIGFAGVLSITVTILGDLYTGPDASTVMGIRASAAGASSLVIPAGAGLLAGLAWQYPFLIHALVFPVVVLAYRYVPETVTRESNLGVRDTLVTYGRQLRGELTDRTLAVLVLGGAIHGSSRLVILTFVPLFVVRELGATLAAAGLVIALRGAARVVVPPFAGPLTGRFSRYHGLLFSLSIMTVSIALIPFTRAVVWTGILVLTYIAGNALYSPILKEGVTDEATGDRRAGVVTSMYVFQFGGEALTPVIFGVILAVSGFEGLFVGAALVVLSYTVLVGFVGGIES